MFSDSVFFFLKISFSNSISNNFIITLIDIGRIIEMAMQSGFLIRGGAYVGECVVDKKRDIFYGPGIIKAHLLEDQKAKCARIIMDSFDYEQLLSLFSYTNTQTPPLRFEYFFRKTNDYYCFDLFEARFYETVSKTMFDRFRQYKYYINNCRDRILLMNHPDEKKYLSKLDFHIETYNNKLLEFDKKEIPADILKLFDGKYSDFPN